MVIFISQLRCWMKLKNIRFLQRYCPAGAYLGGAQGADLHGFLFIALEHRKRKKARFYKSKSAQFNVEQTLC
jgi:hypothetical protein